MGDYHLASVPDLPLTIDLIRTGMVAIAKRGKVDVINERNKGKELPARARRWAEESAVGRV